MFTAEEITDAQRDELAAMPDTASVYRATPTSTAGGWSQWPSNPPVHHTTKCRLVSLPAAIEENAAAELASITHWKLVVPANTDITARDRVGVSGHMFEVAGGMAADSFNVIDIYYLTEILRA